MNLRQLTLACVLALGSAAGAAASTPNTDVNTFATDVRNFNLVSLGNATFTSTNDFQEGIAVKGNLTLDANTIMSGGGSGYVTSNDPSLYVTGTMTLNGGSAKMNGGYASTPGVGSGWTFASKRFTAPSSYGSGILDSTNSSNPKGSTSPLSNSAPSSWSWSTIGSDMTAISSDLAGAPVTGTLSVNSQNLVLTTSVTSGVAVFTLDLSKFSGNSYNGQPLSNVQIAVPANVNYVINVINGSGRSFFPSGVNVNSGSNSGQILWNIVGSGTVTLGGGQIFGAVLAPNASLVTSSTIVNGQIVAANFSNSAAELHYTAFVSKGGSGDICPPPAITSATTASGTTGSPFTYTITASNTPTSYGATGLPPGLTVNSSTGVISGTPTTGGTYTTTVSATNSMGPGTSTVTITIAYPLTVSASPATGGTVTGSGSYAPNTAVTITATPATDYVFTSWTGSGISNLSASSTSDTVTTTQTAVANFTMQPPAITSALTASDIVGTASAAYTVTATHHPTSYSASNLPPGLSINTSTGVISGTPTTAGTYSVALGATNAGGTGTATLTITVVQTYTLTITTPGGGTFTGGGTYNAGTVVGITETASTGYRTNGWTGSGVGMVAYPANFSTTVTLNGNCTLVANFVAQGTLTVAANSGGSATGSGTFDIGTAPAISANPATDYAFTSWTGMGVASPSAASTTVAMSGNQTVTASFAMMPPVITSALTASGIVGMASTAYTITGTHHPTSYSASNLPAGLTVNPTTGVISGTPTAAGTYPVTIGATNAGGTGTATLTITVIPSYTLTITTPGGGTFTGSGTYSAGTVVGITETALTGYRTGGWAGSGIGMVASPANASTTVTLNGNCTLTANFVAQGTLTVTANSGGSATGAGTFDIGTAPAISASPATDYAFTSWTGTGVASPTAAATTVTMSGNQTATASFAMMPPVITSSLTAAGVTGTASAAYTVTATHHPTSYSASNLPAGLSINTATGVISGTPTTAGTFAATIGATNAGGTGTATLTITVTQTYTLTITTPGGGTFTGGGTYNAGTVVGIAETPSAGYRTNGWTGSGAGMVAYPANSSTTVTLNGNCTLVANFVAQGTLTVTANSGGSATGGGTFDVGAAPAISATPAADYAFTSWTGPGVISPTAASTAVTMSGNQTATASFAMMPPVITSALTATDKLNEASASYTITASHHPTSYNATGLPAGLTVITSSGVISGTPTAAGSYNVTISATNGGGTGSATLAVTVSPTYTLTISASPAAGGSATGVGTYDPGTVVSIGEAANPGYRTNGWGGAGVGSVANPAASSTTVTINGNTVLQAQFVQQVALTVAAGAGGTASGSGTYDLGSSPTIAAAPATDYAFTAWAGTGVANATAATTTVTLSGPETVTASFAMIAPAITSALTASGKVNEASASYAITASHHPTSYNAVGLPAGLSVDPSTGLITGTPTAAGTFNVTLSATNAGGTGSAVLVMTIGQTYQLTITGSPAAGGTYSAGGIYDAGAVVGISETAASGYRTSGWSGSGVGMVTYPSNSATTVTMNGNCVLVANFVSQAVLTVSAGTGGTASGSGTFDIGTTPAITAAPAVDFMFTGWTGPNVAAPSLASTTVSLTSAETVTASFSMMPPVITSVLTVGAKLNSGSIYYQITATHHPTSFAATGLPPGLAIDPTTGIITGSPTSAGSFSTSVSATNAGGTGSATLVFTISQTYVLTIAGSPAAGGSFTGQGIYAPGTVVTITESAASGYRNAGWSGSGAGSVYDATASTTTLTLNSDTTLTANFVQQGVLTVVAGTGGTATGSGTYDVGTSAPISAAGASGYVFTGWSGAGIANPNAAATNVTISGDETVTASFLASANPEQLGTVVFPNAIASGQPGVTPTTSSNHAVVTNNGSNAETVTNLTTSGDFSAAVTLPFTLQAGQSLAIPMTFAPSAIGPRAGVMTGVSNDPSNPVFQFVLEGTGTYPSEPPSATIDAATTGFTGSPFNVSSTAFAPQNNLTMHSIEWMSPEGAWTVDVANVSGGNSSRTLGINFPEVGQWTLRAGASTDNGTTWYYSSNVQVTVSSGTQSYTLQSMAVPNSGLSLWYAPSPVASKTYQVQHTNPSTPGGP